MLGLSLGEREGLSDGLNEGEREGDLDGLAECVVTIAVIRPFTTVTVQSSVVNEPVAPIVVATSVPATYERVIEADAWTGMVRLGAPISIPEGVKRHPDTPGFQLVDLMSAAS